MQVLNVSSNALQVRSEPATLPFERFPISRAFQTARSRSGLGLAGKWSVLLGYIFLREQRANLHAYLQFFHRISQRQDASHRRIPNLPQNRQVKETNPNVA